MIKVETIGMLDVAKNNPILVSKKAVKNHSFLKENEILYLIDNTLSGDDAYRENMEIPAGEYLNGFQVDAWKGQKLVVDGKHVTDKLNTVNAKDVMIIDEATGGIKKGTKPAAGTVYFTVSDVGVTLTEAAIKVIVCVA